MFNTVWSLMLTPPIPRRKGQGLVEYALILVLIAVVVVVILRAMGVTLNGVFNTIDTEINSI